MLVDGQEGDDTLIINNVSDTVDDVVTISPTEVGAEPTDSFFGSGGSLGYAGFRQLTVYTSSGNDQVTINGTATGTTTDVATNNGSDLLTVQAPISSTVNYYGGSPNTPPGDQLEVMGDGTTIGSYLPSATTPGDGIVILDGYKVHFTGLEPVDVSQFAKFVFETPNAADFLSINSMNSGQHQITGTSGGVVFESLSFSDIDEMVVDIGVKDSGHPNRPYITSCWSMGRKATTR